MGPRNLLILFFSTLAVSLVILVILFSLFFKNVDLNFDTKMPDAAPDLEEIYGDLPDKDVGKANVNVPQEGARPVTAPADEDARPVEEEKPAEEVSTEPTGEGAEPQQPSGEEAMPGAEEQQPAKPKKDGPKIREVVPTPAEQKPPVPLPPSPEPEKPSADAGNVTYRVSVDGFASKEAAEAKAQALRASGVNGIVKPSGSGYSVQVGVFSNKQNADSAAAQSGGRVRKQ